MARPSKHGTAMTNAERQAEFRARRGEGERRLREAARAWYLATGGSPDLAADDWYIAKALENAALAVQNGGGAQQCAPSAPRAACP
jgi:hypothetical protein